jgi:Tetratricopeptide repeat
MLSKGLFTFPFCCFLLLSAQATPNRRYSFRLKPNITFRATPFFLGSKVTDKERLHPLNHARVKDEIPSVRFLVRINHYVRKEKQIFSVNSGAGCVLHRRTAMEFRRLLRAVEQDSLQKDERDRWIVRACRLLTAFAPESPYDVRAWDAWVPLSQHAEILIDHTKRCGVNALPVALAANQFGVFLLGRGQYAAAEPLCQRALAIREEALGPEHPDVATSLNNLAEFYRAQGQYGKAVPLYQRGLAIREKALGSEHRDVANSLNNLAELYRAQGQGGKAEPLHQPGLAIREKAQGPEHPAVAISLNDLAELYRAQGQYGSRAPLRAGAGDPGKGVGPGASVRGDEPQQPGTALPGPRPIREG